MNVPSDISPSIFRNIECEAERLGPEMVTYWKYSRRRFIEQTELVGNYIRKFTSPPKILDIGPSFQTLIFHQLWGSHVEIDTFGFTDPKFPPPGNGRHIPFDLNEAYYPEKWPKAGPYDLILMFEVIEHLYTSPVQVLKCLKSLCSPTGYIIVSHPNGVSLRHRLVMLSGRHPFEQIRETRDNPGHYRESTRGELCKFGETAGLKVADVRMQNLTSSENFVSKSYRFLSRLMPSNLRKDLTVIFQNH